MKYSGKTGLLSFFVVLFCFTESINGQNMFQDEPGEKVREIAKERTNMWVKELAMSAKQADLMEKKIIEYTMKRTDLMNSKMNEDAKVKRLMALQIEEEKDMGDILTRPQYTKYKRMNKEGIKSQDKSPDRDYK